MLDTVCVWNSVGIRDHYNGEYVLQNGDSAGRPYWKLSSNTCPLSSSYYLSYVQDDERWWCWMIGDTLQSTYISRQPYCEDGNIRDPTKCTAGWYYWIVGSNDPLKSLPMTVSDGSCPSLQCDEVKLSNTGYTQCDKTFVRNRFFDNVFQNVNGTYLYFNKHTFKWYCSDILNHTECADVTNSYVSSKDDGWNDVNIGHSFQLVLDNTNIATFECVESTPNPTANPSLPTTASPITAIPTTASPTKKWSKYD